MAGAQATITVSPHGPVRTLTAAVQAASPHSKIIVKPGVYRESTIVVDKPVEIIGEGWPVLNGANARQIMTVTADSVTIRGLHFEHVGTSFTEDWAAVRFQRRIGQRYGFRASADALSKAIDSTTRFSGYTSPKSTTARFAGTFCARAGDAR